VPAEGWYIDGEPLESHAVVLEDRHGWDDTPEVRGDDVELLGRHGRSWRRKKYAPGRKTLAVAVHGVDEAGLVPAEGSAQRARYERNLDALIRVFAVRHRPLLVERVHADGSRRQAECEVTSALTPAVTGDTYGLMSVEFAIPGAFWSDVDPQTYTLPYVVGTGGTQALEVFSLQGQTGYCGDAIVTITGPCTTVSVRDHETGLGFSYGALTLGQSLIVDSGAFTATVASVSVITAVTLDDTQLLEVGPAPQTYRGPVVDVTTTGAGAGFSVTFVTHRKWLR
jgi:hypothetical protein